MEPLIILGIDPGFHITGYSILKKDQTKTVVLDYGYLKLDPKKHLSERIGIFYSFLKDKINTFQINELALETPFLGKNVQTFLKLGYLRGCLYLLANQHNLAIHEFSPRQIKTAITGFGGATKDQVALMVLKMFPKLDELGNIEKNDVTDAFAVSICGVWENQRKKLLALAK